MAKKKKITIWQRLREKYRIIVLNEDTLTEQWHLHLSWWGVIVMVTTIFLIALVIYSLAILYTPIKNYLPGYSENVRQQLIDESTRIDSITTSLEAHRQYLDIIKQILAGEVQSDTVQSLDSMQIIMREQLLEAKNEATAEFIAQYETKEKNNMQLFENIQNISNSVTVFFVPVHGAIIQHFSAQEKQYHITIQTMNNENVASVLDGAVIYINQGVNCAYTIMIKHTDYISIYQGIKKPLKQVGDYILAGDCIGIAGENPIGFELWKNDKPINPEEVIAF